MSLVENISSLKIESELKMEPGSLTFEDETLKYIVEKHTNEEKVCVILRDALKLSTVKLTFTII